MSVPLKKEALSPPPGWREGLHGRGIRLLTRNPVLMHDLHGTTISSFLFHNNIMQLRLKAPNNMNSFFTTTTSWLLLLVVVSPPFHACAAAVVGAVSSQPQSQKIFPPQWTNSTFYTDWYLSNEKSDAAYTHHVFLAQDKSNDDAADGGAALFWKVMNNATSIQFAIAVRASGWVGLGISDAGGMLGSDIALYTVNNGGTTTNSNNIIVDTHVVDEHAIPITDDCQNWNYVSVRSTNAMDEDVDDDGWIILELSRLLIPDNDTTQDIAIINDAELWIPPTRIIAAWGNDDTGVSFHGSKRARSAVRIFGQSSYNSNVVGDEDGYDDGTDMNIMTKTLDNESDGFFDIVENDYEIPPDETTYYSLCKTFDELNLTLSDVGGQSGMVTMIGAVPIIDKDTAPYVHHFTVYLTDKCNSTSFESYIYRSLIYAWAPGNEGMALPNNVGFPMFENANKQAIDVVIHYNNPDHITGLKDSSGVRFYYTNEEREYRAGIYDTGDPWVMLMNTTINTGLTKYSFTCPGACSSTYMTSPMRSSSDEEGGGEEGVTILSEMLHVHKTGVRMTNEVIRNGEVYHTAIADVYDFDQQGAYMAPQGAYKVLPGDSFRTTCYYENGSQFGMGSQDEMCVAFLLYYPVQEVLGTPWQCAYRAGIVPDYGSGCSTELEYGDLDGPDGLGRNYGSPGECTAPTDVGSDAAWFSTSYFLQTAISLLIVLIVL